MERNTYKVVTTFESSTGEITVATTEHKCVDPYRASKAAVRALKKQLGNNVYGRYSLNVSRVRNNMSVY